MAALSCSSSRQIQGAGTPEAEWQAWPGLATLPMVNARALVPKGERAVIVAPHPDDEVLGAAGLMVQMNQLGRSLLLIAATDGTGSHPSSTVWPRDRLAHERPLETQRALAILGLGHLPISRLGLQDGQLAHDEVVLTEAVTQLLRPGDVVFTTWRFDGHPDHEACGRACALASARAGARLMEMPIWAWHWAQPGDHRMPWSTAFSLPLPASLAHRKRLAVQAFTSQIEPDPTRQETCVLPATALARLLRPMEVFFR